MLKGKIYLYEVPVSISILATDDEEAFTSICTALHEYQPGIVQSVGGLPGVINHGQVDEHQGVE